MDNKITNGKLMVVTSLNTWSDLRVLFESGEYPNLDMLYDAQKKNYRDMPAMHDLKQRCAKECWEKERFQEIRTEVKRRNLVELYASLGMDDEEQARYRVECVRAVDGVKAVIAQLHVQITMLDPNSREFTDTLGKIKVLSDTMFKGMNTSLTALQDISKLTGDYAPVTTKEVKGHGYVTKDGLKGIEEMSEEEIIQDLKRMKAAGISLDEIEDLKTSPDAQGGPNGE